MVESEFDLTNQSLSLLHCRPFSLVLKFVFQKKAFNFVRLTTTALKLFG